MLPCMCGECGCRAAGISTSHVGLLSFHLKFINVIILLSLHYCTHQSLCHFLTITLRILKWTRLEMSLVGWMQWYWCPTSLFLYWSYGWKKLMSSCVAGGYSVVHSSDHKMLWITLAEQRCELSAWLHHHHYHCHSFPLSDYIVACLTNSLLSHTFHHDLIVYVFPLHWLAFVWSVLTPGRLLRFPCIRLIIALCSGSLQRGRCGYLFPVQLIITT